MNDLLTYHIALVPRSFFRFSSARSFPRQIHNIAPIMAATRTVAAPEMPNFAAVDMAVCLVAGLSVGVLLEAGSQGMGDVAIFSDCRAVRLDSTDMNVVDTGMLAEEEVSDVANEPSTETVVSTAAEVLCPSLWVADVR